MNLVNIEVIEGSQGVLESFCLRINLLRILQKVKTLTTIILSIVIQIIHRVLDKRNGMSRAVTVLEEE